MTGIVLESLSESEYVARVVVSDIPWVGVPESQGLKR